MTSLGTQVDGLVGSGAAEAGHLLGGNTGDVLKFYIGAAFVFIIVIAVFAFIRRKG